MRVTRISPEDVEQDRRLREADTATGIEERDRLWSLIEAYVEDYAKVQVFDVLGVLTESENVACYQKYRELRSALGFESDDSDS